MRSPTEITLLTDLAARFRSLVESKRAIVPASLEGFPKRGLEQACDLFGQYLRGNGFASVVVASGTCAGARKHWWVETERLVIDLAARERDGDLPTVLVTRASDWEVEGPVDRRQPRAVVPEDVAKLLVSFERA